MSSISVTESTDTAAVTIPPPLTIQKGVPTMTIIFSGRIYDYKKIREKLPDALLISVMRKPWRYTPRDILILKDLGPPEWLLNYVHEHQEDQGQDLIDLQAHYAAEYIKYLVDDAALAVGELEAMMREHEKIVLLCHEKKGEFCHRHLLRYFLVDAWDILNGGEIRI